MLFTPKLIVTNEKGEKRILNNAGRLGQSIHLVPRSECSFRRYRLKGAGKSALKAVELRAENEARSGHDIFKTFRDSDNLNASIWSYDSKFVSGMRSLPETLCYSPLSHGSRLVQCISGVEGQVWSDGVLIASRWWHDKPSRSEWESFIRVAPIEFGSDLPAKPAIEEVAYQKRFPVIAFDTHELSDVVTPKRVAVFASILTLFSVGFMSSKYIHYSTNLKQVQAKIDEVSAEANVVLSKRRKALTNINTIQKYKEVEPKHSLVGALGGVAGILQKQGVTIRDLRVRNDRIEFQMLGNSSIRVPELVSQLERTRFLTDVNIEGNQRSGFTIKAQFRNAGSPIAAGSSEGAVQ